MLTGIRDITITTKIGIPRPDLRARARRAEVVYRRFIRPLMSHLPRMKALLLGLAGWSGSTSSLFATAMPRRRLERGEVLRNLEKSLKQLNRTAVDLYLLHEPNQFELTDELRELFIELQRDRVVGAFGLAFGGIADTGTSFGTVVQGKYAVGLPTRGTLGRVRIFHGVLRQGRQGGNRYAAAGAPGDRLSQVLVTHPDAAVIFSASAPHQITSIMKQLSP